MTAFGTLDGTGFEVQIERSLLDDSVQQFDSILLLSEQFQKARHQAKIPTCREALRIKNTFPFFDYFLFSGLLFLFYRSRTLLATFPRVGAK